MKNILKNLGAAATAAGENYTLMLLLFLIVAVSVENFH